MCGAGNICASKILLFMQLSLICQIFHPQSDFYSAWKGGSKPFPTPMSGLELVAEIDLLKLSENSRFICVQTSFISADAWISTEAVETCVRQTEKSSGLSVLSGAPWSSVLSFEEVALRFDDLKELKYCFRAMI